MMAKPDKSKSDEQICPICQKIISKHKPEEMLACSRKMLEKRSESGEDLGV